MTDVVPAIDIQPAHWAIVRDILRRFVPQHTVWAFGSRVTREARPYSDLDLAVIATEPLSLDLTGALAEAFSESDLPWTVDIVDWAALGEPFRRSIERDHVVVWGARGSTQAVLDTADLR